MRAMRGAGANRVRRVVLGLVLPLGVAVVAGCAGDEETAPRGEDEAVSADRDRSVGEEPWTDALAEELRAMGEDDRAVREGLGPETASDTAFLGRMARTDSVLSRRLRALVARHGWPRVSEVGRDAVEAAFLIVQHSPFAEWRAEMLPHVRRAVEAGELDPQSFALMYDRVQVRMGRPQRYGTQLTRGSDGRLHLDPLEDPQAVDSLRARLGLPPLEAYLDVVEQATGMEVARDELPSDTAGAR